MRGLKGKSVLVTGSTSGIGQVIAVRFAEYGANVAINYLRRPEDAAETEDHVHACLKNVRRAGVKDVLVRGDVSKEGDVEQMVEQTVEQLGGIDVLVNNAGTSRASTKSSRSPTTSATPPARAGCRTHSHPGAGVRRAQH